MKELLKFLGNHLPIILILIILFIFTLCFVFFNDFNISIWHVFVSTMLALIAGFAFKLLYDRERQSIPIELLSFDDKVQYKSRISHSIRIIFTYNLGEFIVLSLILILVLILLSAVIENIRYLTPDSLSPIIIGLMLSLFSLMVTVLGMHYSFLAESRARLAEENSQKLLEEKGQFLPHFSGFIQRIIRKINSPNGLLSDLQQESEPHFYFIKCMFLTPFLGHAGATSNDYAMARNINLFQLGINSLIQNSCCKVSMVMPMPEVLVRWYAEIQWVEIMKKLRNLMDKRGAKGFKKMLKSMFPEFAVIDDDLFQKFNRLFDDLEKWKKNETTYENINKDVINQLLKIILFKKSTEALGIYNKRNELVTHVRSFKDLSEEYRVNYENKLSISYSKYIPFQMFLVTKPIIDKPQLFPQMECFRTVDGNIVEEGKFVVISFVGDKTYSSVIERIKKDESGIMTDGGIKNLLENLHSAFYSEDPRLCEIINNHFKHYFSQEDVRHFPDVNPTLWQKDELINL